MASKTKLVRSGVGRDLPHEVHDFGWNTRAVMRRNGIPTMTQAARTRDPYD